LKPCLLTFALPAADYHKDSDEQGKITNNKQYQAHAKGGQVDALFGGIIDIARDYAAQYVPLLWVLA
jgi:hypothetical protein